MGYEFSHIFIQVDKAMGIKLLVEFLFLCAT